MFGYIGVGLTIPWNQSGRYIVALEFDFYQRMPKPGETAAVVLIDTENDNRIVRVDRTRAWNLQQGTMLYWHPQQPETQFFFNDLDPETGIVYTVLYDIDKRKRVRQFRFDHLSIGNSGVAPSDEYFAAVNFGKISNSREVISYAGAHDPKAEGPANPNDDGLFRVDIATGENRLLVSYRQLAQLLNLDEDHAVTVQHTLWNRDSDRIHFVVRGGADKRKKPNAWCIVHADGTSLKRTQGDGHPEWADEKTLILPAGDRFRLFDVDANRDIGYFGKRGDFPDPRNDNALSPDGEWFVGSHQLFKRAGNDTSGAVYTFLRRTDEQIIRSPLVPGMNRRGLTRIDPAPRWNRTSDAILVPGVAKDGTRQLFVVSHRDN